MSSAWADCFGPQQPRSNQRMKIDELIAAVQRRLGITADGRAGPETWMAIHAFVIGKTFADETSTVALIDSVDARSEARIATLLPGVRPFARALVQKAALDGIRVKVISGLRSVAEQDALYALGRKTPGLKVTNARGGYSSHNFGFAFDIGVFEGDRYLGDLPKYKAVGALGMDIGLEWGGNWKNPVDQAHFELRPSWAEGLSAAQLLASARARVQRGEDLVA